MALLTPREQEVSRLVAEGHEEPQDLASASRHRTHREHELVLITPRDQSGSTDSGPTSKARTDVPGETIGLSKKIDACCKLIVDANQFGSGRF
jgi:hypothetical protein